MAGSRRRSGQPVKAERKAAWWAAEIAAAPDAETQLATAVRYVRSIATDLDDPGPMLNEASRALAEITERHSRRAA